MGNDFLGLLGGLAEAGGAYALGEYGARQAQETGQLGKTLAEDYATRLQQQGQFRPYTVTTGIGGLQAQPGGLTTALTPEQQAAQQQLFTSGLGMLGGVGQGTEARTQQLFGQLQQMAAPEQERQRLALEERLLGQGRLGLRTAQYGGAPEQLALEKAIQEQQFANLLGARQQAMAEEQQQYNIGTGLFGQSYVPQQQFTMAAQPGLQTLSEETALQRQILPVLSQQYGAGLESLLQGETVAGNIRQAGLQGLFNALVGDRGNPELEAILTAMYPKSAGTLSGILGGSSGLLGRVGSLLGIGNDTAAYTVDDYINQALGL
jgi:hypothetical protein